MAGKRELQNFVDGAFVGARDGASTDIVNPSTGEVFATAPQSGLEDVDAAFQAAARSFDGVWRDTTPSERMGYLLKMADAIESNAEEMVAVESENTGKPRALTMSEEIPPMVDQVRFFAGAARMLEGKSSAEYMRGFSSWIRREPVGVIGSVTPWNYPMMMAVWKFAPALAAGNTIVLKPSDTTPASTVKMAELFADILPPGVFNVVCGDRDTGAALVSHPIPGTGVDHRQYPGGHRRRQVCRRVGQTSPSRVGRQGTGDRLRRRGPRTRLRRASLSPGTSTPARTARRRPEYSPGLASTTTSYRPSPNRPRPPNSPATRRTTTGFTSLRSTTRTSWRTSRGWWNAHRDTPRC